MLTDERRGELQAQVRELRAGALRKRYYAVLWTDNPAKTDDDFLEVMPEYFAHLSALEADGIMFGSGPLTPPEGVAETYEGLSIIRAESHEAARALLDAMPMARHGLRTYELFAWDMSVGTLSLRVALKSGAFALE